MFGIFQSKAIKRSALVTLYTCLICLAYVLLSKGNLLIVIIKNALQENNTWIVSTIGRTVHQSKKSNTFQVTPGTLAKEEAANFAEEITVGPPSFSSTNRETVVNHDFLAKSTVNINREIQSVNSQYVTKSSPKLMQVLNPIVNNKTKFFDTALNGRQAVPTSGGIVVGKLLLTLFTTWEEEENKYLCRNNTIRNWNLLGPSVKTILFTNNENLAYRVKQLGWDVLPIRKTGGTGVPVLKAMFEQVVGVVDSQFYAYINGDIIFTSDLIKTLHAVKESKIYMYDDLLVIGQRTDVCFVITAESIDYEQLRFAAKTRGSPLRSPYKTDYFIAKRGYPWNGFPDLVIGRPYVDSYLVADAAKRGHLLDVTQTSLAVHQITKTGKAGTDEGLTHPDMDYNIRLLRGKQFETGHVYMSTYTTSFGHNGDVIVRSIDYHRHPYIDDGQFVCEL